MQVSVAFMNHVSSGALKASYEFDSTSCNQWIMYDIEDDKIPASWCGVWFHTLIWKISLLMGIGCHGLRDSVFNFSRYHHVWRRKIASSFSKSQWWKLRPCDEIQPLNTWNSVDEIEYKFSIKHSV